MRPVRLASLAITLAIAAPAFAQDLALPATVEGNLVIEVPASEVEDNTTQSNYGTLTAGDTQYSVDVPTPVLEACGCADGGDVKATFGSGDDGDGFMVYTVTALEKK
jgi:hypothetical protein